MNNAEQISTLKYYINILFYIKKLVLHTYIQTSAIHLRPSETAIPIVLSPA